MQRILLAAAALAALAGPALALSGTLVARGDSGKVFVWQSADAHSEAIKLIQAGVHQSNPALVLRLLACRPASGTKVVVTSAGFATHDVLIVDGPDAGCRGNIAREDLKDVR